MILFNKYCILLSKIHKKEGNLTDNIDITPGIGATIKTDSLSGSHVQYIKLMDGTDGGTNIIPGTSENGLDVDVTRLPSNPTTGANVATTIRGFDFSSETYREITAYNGYLNVAVNGTAITAPIIHAENAIQSVVETNGYGMVALGVRKDTPADLASVNGRATTFEFDSTGKLWTHIGEISAGTNNIGVVNFHCGLSEIKTERILNTSGSPTSSSIFVATSGSRNYITSIMIYNTSASTNGYIDLKDGLSGSIFATIPAPVGGTTMSFSSPLRQTTLATALVFQVSEPITSVIITLVGFQSSV
jgi:hypothetical protein